MNVLTRFLINIFIAKGSFRTNRNLAKYNSVKIKVSNRLNVKHFIKNRLDFAPNKDKGFFKVIKSVLLQAKKTLNIYYTDYLCVWKDVNIYHAKSLQSL